MGTYRKRLRKCVCVKEWKRKREKESEKEDEKGPDMVNCIVNFNLNLVKKVFIKSNLIETTATYQS